MHFYFPPLNIQIFVVDSADKRRMEETGVELGQLMTEEKLEGVPLLVLANKQDLLSALSPAEMAGADYLDLATVCGRKRTYEILPCSAKTGEGLKEAMEARHCSRRLHL